jgi:hypothetical protein
MNGHERPRDQTRESLRVSQMTDHGRSASAVAGRRCGRAIRLGASLFAPFPVLLLHPAVPLLLLLSPTSLVTTCPTTDTGNFSSLGAEASPAATQSVSPTHPPATPFLPLLCPRLLQARARTSALIFDQNIHPSTISFFARFEEMTCPSATPFLSPDPFTSSNNPLWFRASMNCSYL